MDYVYERVPLYHADTKKTSVGSAVNELYSKGLIEKKKHRKRIYYYFTLKFLGYLNMLPKVIYVNTQKYLGNIPQNFLGKNILKENENTSFSSSLTSEADSSELDKSEEPLSEEDSNLAFAKATIKHLSGNPMFVNKIKELKEKYNL